MVNQIVHYGIHTSVFDCICFAVFRFVTLEIVYAGLQLRHWWPALVTMILSTFFMVRSDEMVSPCDLLLCKLDLLMQVFNSLANRH